MAVTLTNQSPYHSLKAHKIETTYKFISSTATNLTKALKIMCSIRRNLNLGTTHTASIGF